MRRTDLFAGAVAGLSAGGAISAYLRIKARAAVAVRPRLADVGFLDALLAGHGADWLFYHESFVATFTITAILGLMGLVVAVGWSR